MSFRPLWHALLEHRLYIGDRRGPNFKPDVRNPYVWVQIKVLRGVFWATISSFVKHRLYIAASKRPLRPQFELRRLVHKWPLKLSNSISSQHYWQNESTSSLIWPALGMDTWIRSKRGLRRKLKRRTGDDPLESAFDIASVPATGSAVSRSCLFP